MKILTKSLCLSGVILFFCCTEQRHSATDTSIEKVEFENIPLKNIQDVNLSSDYSLIDDIYGTTTKVKILNGKRYMQTNSLPNHTTGTFPCKGNPNSIAEQHIVYEFPMMPIFAGKPRWIREPGVAINGVKFEPETAERLECETGEIYRVEAFQDLINLGLDENNAHVQPTGAYHYHGIPQGLINLLSKEEDVVLVGFAKDGFPIYYSHSNQFKPSYQLSAKNRTGNFCQYNRGENSINENFEGTIPNGNFVSDWMYVEGLGDLDECNGVEYKGNYSYFITEGYPYIARCLMGEFQKETPPIYHHHHHGEGKPPPPGFHHH